MKSTEVHLSHEGVQHGEVKWFLQITNIFSEHLLGESFSAQQELGHSRRTVLDKVFLAEVFNSSLGTGVEDVEADFLEDEVAIKAKDAPSRPRTPRTMTP